MTVLFIEIIQHACTVLTGVREAMCHNCRNKVIHIVILTLLKVGAYGCKTGIHEQIIFNRSFIENLQIMYQINGKEVLL